LGTRGRRGVVFSAEAKNRTADMVDCWLTSLARSFVSLARVSGASFIWVFGFVGFLRFPADLFCFRRFFPWFLLVFRLLPVSFFELLKTLNIFQF
jgi:hypothetical protein